VIAALLLLRKSSGKTVNVAYIKKALAILQPIFKTNFRSPHCHLSLGLQVAAKCKDNPPTALSCQILP
jgi:hypothetical protein